MPLRINKGSNHTGDRMGVNEGQERNLRPEGVPETIKKLLLDFKNCEHLEERKKPTNKKSRNMALYCSREDSPPCSPEG
jgi:hypothetical protein